MHLGDLTRNERIHPIIVILREFIWGKVLLENRSG
jgi:hypothetical protein